MVPAVSNRASPTPSYSGFPTINRSYQYGTLTLCGTPSQMFPVLSVDLIWVLQPLKCRNTLGLGSFPFARHYLGNHYCFLFLQVLRCFSSLGSPPLQDNRSSTCWVAPFGHLRIKDRVHLPVTFRSLPRPSSPLRA